MTSAASPDYRARLRRTALLSATMLATGLVTSAQAAIYGIVVNQISDPLVTGLSIPATAPTQGMFSPVQNWPLNAVSLGMMPNGKLISYGTPPDEPSIQNGRYFDVWDPTVGFATSGHAMLQGIPFVNSFCSTAVLQADGSLMVSGGIFDSGTDKGSAVVNGTSTGVSALTAQLANDRYYATMITLADGRKLIMGGSYPYLGGYADPQGSIDKGYMTGMTPEVYGGGQWSSLFGANSRDAFGPDNQRWWYPRAWVAPNGKVFGISADRMWMLDPTGTGAITAWPFKQPQQSATSAANAPNVGPTSTAVMYDTGKFLQVGGNSYDNFNGFLASSVATTVDITSGTPVVTDTAPMNFGRSWAQSTILPNGQVAVTGGSLFDNQDGSNAVLQTETWDPKTGKWSLGASGAVYRGYHSTAILMQNGALLIAGGGAPGPVNNQNVEVYYPPYLFTASGGNAALAPRPSIVSLASITPAYAQSLQFELNSQNGLSQVVLVALSEVTHSFNSTQRRYVANFSQSGLSVAAQMPASSAIAPPGYYQLIAIDKNGVPSPGVIVGLGGVAAPNQTSTLVAATGTSSGGNGGNGTSVGGAGTGTGTAGGTANSGSATAGAGPNLIGTTPLKASHSGMCLAVPASNNNTDGAPVTQQVCSGGPEQQWKFTSVSGGYTVVNAANGRCLDVSGLQGGTLTIGTQVFSWSCSGNANQVWASATQGAGISLVSKGSNLCLDVYQGSTQVGAGPVQWTCNGAPNQIFAAPTTQTATANTVPIKASHSGLCLAVPATNNNTDGAPVTQQVCSGGSEQQWKFTTVSGGYTVVNAANGRCLDVSNLKGGSLNVGTQVFSWSCSGNSNQVWAKKAQGAGTSLVSNGSNLCLDVYQGSTQVGAGPVQWTCNGAANQIFTGL